jgi:hypothetical protein
MNPEKKKPMPKGLPTYRKGEVAGGYQGPKEQEKTNKHSHLNFEQRIMYIGQGSGQLSSAGLLERLHALDDEEREIAEGNIRNYIRACDKSDVKPEAKSVNDIIIEAAAEAERETP